MDNTLLFNILATFVLLDLILVFFIFWKRRQRRQAFDQKFYADQWHAILEIKKASPEAAVIKADKLLDKSLTDLGFTGTFAEKLTPAQHMLKNPKPLWAAHKLRNRIAHEPDHETTPHEANQALSAYRSALQKFGIKL